MLNLGAPYDYQNCKTLGVLVLRDSLGLNYRASLLHQKYLIIDIQVVLNSAQIFEELSICGDLLYGTQKRYVYLYLLEELINEQVNIGMIVRSFWSSQPLRKRCQNWTWCVAWANHFLFFVCVTTWRLHTVII